MTRFGLDNEQYTCVYGIDHANGRFLQIWRSNPPRIEDDVPLVDIDEVSGVQCFWSEDYGKGLDDQTYATSVHELVAAHLGPKVWALITRIERNFNQDTSPHRGHLDVDDVIDVLRALGFNEPMLAIVRGGLAPTT